LLFEFGAEMSARQNVSQKMFLTKSSQFLLNRIIFTVYKWSSLFKSFNYLNLKEIDRFATNLREKYDENFEKKVRCIVIQQKRKNVLQRTKS